MMLFRFDESQILHILASIEFRIDYYNKRIKEIEEIKDSLQPKTYKESINDLKQTQYDYLYLSANIKHQLNNQKKLERFPILDQESRKSGLGIKK